MSFIAAIFQRYQESQTEVDDKRRESSLYYFQHAAMKKTDTQPWQPTNIPYCGHRRYPSIVIDNWAAAWKVRRHYEEQTELRKSKGKVIY